MAIFIFISIYLRIYCRVWPSGSGDEAKLLKVYKPRIRPIYSEKNAGQSDQKNSSELQTRNEQQPISICIK